MADLSSRYANALFEISEESGTLNDYLQQAEYLKSVLEGEGALGILTHPRVSVTEKYAFLDTALGNAVHEDLFNFMKLVVSKNREAYLLPALDKLIGLIRERQNYTTAKIVSAVPLSEEQGVRLQNLLKNKLGKQVDLTVIVDSAVIAGISIHVDGYFLDRTLRTMLKDMNETVRRGAD
jgi:F-type H+-transporting ATPase subunit delta